MPTVTVRVMDIYRGKRSASRVTVDGMAAGLEMTRGTRGIHDALAPMEQSTWLRAAHPGFGLI